MADDRIPMRFTGDGTNTRFTPAAMPSGERYLYSAGATVQAKPEDVAVLQRLQFELQEQLAMSDTNIPDSAFEPETNKESIEREQEAQRRLAEGVEPSEDPSAEDEQQDNDLAVDPNSTPEKPEQADPDALRNIVAPRDGDQPKRGRSRKSDD